MAATEAAAKPRAKRVTAAENIAPLQVNDKVKAGRILQIDVDGKKALVEKEENMHIRRWMNSSELENMCIRRWMNLSELGAKIGN